MLRMWNVVFVGLSVGLFFFLFFFAHMYALGDLGGTCSSCYVESVVEVSHRSRRCVALRHPDLELESSTGGHHG